ncbi:hypothetical protein XIS1_1570002 [Xenorhabdus innexi]|uniref:Uncharacterized protein n=1 Tax=Xenorhabdus innexi TaxID=290109 RepID=A0A1N6MUX6_9GAMM|nr:hypothetical protein Xinn_02055 [Xenorhabdus innexi]SIP72587.1 hypothetical protein XIS1_1570002 [Xenorhabdus innexi]
MLFHQLNPVLCCITSSYAVYFSNLFSIERAFSAIGCNSKFIEQTLMKKLMISIPFKSNRD